MKIHEVMTPDVETVWPDDTLQQAAIKMKDRDIGPLPVCERDRIVGILTDRDITVRAVAMGLDPKATSVRDVMSQPVVYCFDDDDEEDAARLMQEQQVRRILVVDNDERLVGIVSLGDLAVESIDPSRIAELLQEVSAPTYRMH
jgi:CBS domain-containing protein